MTLCRHIAVGALLLACCVAYAADGSSTERGPLGTVNVRDFGADPTGVADSTAAIQAAVDHAQSLVAPAVDKVGDPVGGCDVEFSGVFRISEPIRVSTSNVNLVGRGGATIYPYFTSAAGFNGAKPVLIIGTAEQWQTGGYTGTTKYNRVTGIHIKRVQGYQGFIGLLISGTRNCTVSNCFVERGWCGIYLEDTSELYASQNSCIGCTYGIVLDSRYNRAAANSVLNVACTANDVSSTTFDQTTLYYPQHTGILAMNAGSVAFDNMTIGQFSDNPDSGSPGLGFPANYAGIHLVGMDSLWTRGFLVESCVFEANQSESHDCILLEANNKYNPIFGATFNNCVVQTYANDYEKGAVTTLVRTSTSNGGKVFNVKVSNCGYTFGKGGYTTGRLAEVHGYAGVTFDNCYPPSAYSTGTIGYAGVISNVEWLERVGIDAFPPTGWLADGATAGCSRGGGSAGQMSYLDLRGSADEITVYKDFVYLDRTPELAAVMVSFLARGDADLACWVRVNGAADTDSCKKTDANAQRYGNALIDQNVDSPSQWRRFTFCFPPFSADYGFNTVQVHIGKRASDAARHISLSDIKVGYVLGGARMPNDPFE